MQDKFLAMIVDRSETGPYCKESDFDLMLAKFVMELVAKYALEYDPKILVPHDDALVDRVYKAAVDLVAEVGIYNQSTERRMLFTREEIDRATRVFVEAMKAQGGDSEQDGVSVQSVFSEEGKKMVAEGLALIVEDVVTPERIEQTAELIKEKADEWNKHATWHFFIREIRSKFEKGPTFDDVKYFFATALYGEASTAGIPESQED